LYRLAVLKPSIDRTMDNRYLHCVAASVTPRDHFRVKRPGQKFRSSNIGRIFFGTAFSHETQHAGG